MKKKPILSPPDQEHILEGDPAPFVGETVLLVATGNQDAKFYLAHNGTIKTVDSFLIAKPRYSDREGYFKSTVQGKTIRSGAASEDHKERSRSVFTQEFRKRFITIAKKHQPEKLYIFSPDHVRTHIKKSLPKAWHSKVTMEITGNHFKTHPTKLVRAIAKRSESKRVKPTTVEEQKILRRHVPARMARHIVKRAP